MKRLRVLLGVVLLASCSTDRAGWAPRGKYWVLDEMPGLEIRRGAQTVDPATKDLVIAWVGARATEGNPPLLACTLTIFEDRNGNRAPDPDETIDTRESRTVTTKVLFGDVRARDRFGSPLFARLDAQTQAGVRTVTWALVPDGRH